MAQRRVARGPRWKLIWARMVPAISSLERNAGLTQYSEAQDLLQTFRTAAGITAGPVGLTVMRMRFGIHSTNVTVGQAGQFILGVWVMDLQEAALAEVDATPYSPTTDPHADWMCFEPFGQEGGQIGSTAVIQHAVDVRAMRKIDELGQTLVAIVSTVPPIVATVATLSVNVTSSVLLALP